MVAEACVCVGADGRSSFVATRTSDDRELYFNLQTFLQTLKTGAAATCYYLRLSLPLRPRPRPRPPPPLLLPPPPPRRRPVPVPPLLPLPLRPPESRAEDMAKIASKSSPSCCLFQRSWPQSTHRWRYRYCPFRSSSCTGGMRPWQLAARSPGLMSTCLLQRHCVQWFSKPCWPRTKKPQWPHSKSSSVRWKFRRPTPLAAVDVLSSS